MANYDAPALDKGLDILEFLSAQSIPQAQQDIAQGIGRKPNEIYRMLMSLENRGYIAKEPVSGKFALTLKLYQLAHNHSPVDTVVKAAEMPMSELAQSINQSVHLSVLYHNKLMVVSQAKSSTPVSLSVEIGSLFPLEKTVSGKIILASLTEDARQQIFADSISQKTITKKGVKEMLESLKEIEGEKCYFQKSELTEGVTDFSAPIADMQGNVLAVLAVSALTSQMREKISTEEIKQQLIETVDVIRKSLGFS